MLAEYLPGRPDPNRSVCIFAEQGYVYTPEWVFAIVPRANLPLYFRSRQSMTRNRKL